MNFAFSEEQEMLRTTARAVLAGANSIGIAHARTLDGATLHLGAPVGLDDTELWRTMAQLGWLGLPFPAVYGGDERGFMDLAIVLEEMGRVAGPPAFTTTVAVCGLTLLRHAPEPLATRWLPRVVDGSARLALCARAAADAQDGVRARRADDGGAVIEGCVPLVEEGHRCDAYLVAAGEGSASLLALVDAATPGITVRSRRTVTGERADVAFSAVRVGPEDVVATGDEAAFAITTTLQRGAVAACLDMVGAGDAVLEMVTAYVADRVQFGRPVGSFQAVQHHAANMAVDSDASRLITYEAAWRLSEGLDAAMEVAMAKAWTSQAYRRVATLGHQLFGGVGLMREHDMHLFMRRGRRDALAFGSATDHLDELAGILAARGTPWPE